jgi:predicted neutral ceramidase superfamily lipid hydrolase
MTSSIRAKVVDQIRAAKRKAREIGDAVEKGVKSANDKLEHLEVAVGGVSAEASSSDSVKPVKKKAAPKKAAKAPAKKRGRPRKEV